MYFPLIHSSKTFLNVWIINAKIKWNINPKWNIWLFIVYNILCTHVLDIQQLSNDILQFSLSVGECMEIVLFNWDIPDKKEAHFFEIYVFDLPSLFLRVKLGFKESPSSREKWNLAPFAELSLSVAVIVWITWNKN